MKKFLKNYIIYAVSLAFVIGLMSFEILTPTGKSGVTGAPGEGNCTSCHSGTLNSGPASVSITSSPSLANGYTAGSDYTISVTISNSTSPNNNLFGVDAEVLLSSGANAGTITITNTTNTKIKTFTSGGNVRNQVVHTGTGATGPTNQTFSFKWTAPASGSGTATFYAMIMGADDDGSTSGDEVYSKTLAVDEAAAALDPPTLTYPSNNAVDRSLSETLTWNSATGATSYYVQVATDASFTNLVFDGNVGNNLSKTISGMSNSTAYYWHVASVNAQKTSAYASTWKFTTVAPALDPPTLAYPSNNAVDRSLSETLTWNSATGATSYYVQVATDASFTTLIFDGNVGNNLSKTISGMSNSTDYYWHVASVNASKTSAYTSTWKFTTIAPTLQPPTLSSPANNAVDRALSETISWNTATGATSYYLQVATDASFTTLVFDGNVGNYLSKAITGLTNSTVYYWHVASVNASTTSAYASAWKFTTVAAAQPPQAPTLTYPANNAVDRALTETLTWNSSTGATSYYVQVAKDAAFTSLVFDGNVGNSLSKAISGMTNSTDYYWHVAAINAAGTSSYTSTWKFTTVAPVQIPSAPSLSAPANNSVDRSVSETLTWNTVSGATSYYVQVAKDAAFTSLVFDGNVGASASKAISGLANSTDYYWHVAAVNSAGTSSYSADWKFTTIAASSNDVVVLSSPANNKTNVPLNQKFTWKKYSSSAYYQIQISKYANFTSTVVKKNVKKDLEFQTDQLNNFQTYYWRVGVVVGSGVENWSEVRSFKTVAKNNGDEDDTRNHDSEYHDNTKSDDHKDSFQSAPAVVTETGIISSVNLYPNPSDSRAFLSISNSVAGDAKVIITSVDGKVVKTDTIKLNSGETSYEINTDLLTSGIYNITIITSNNILNRQLVVTK